jgi:hypothetical protein
MKSTNRSFENVMKFKYVEVAVTDQILINEEINIILNLSNASVQNLPLSCFLSKNFKTATQNCNFAFSFVWMLNWIADIKNRPYTKCLKIHNCIIDWRKLHNQMLQYEMEWHVACMREKRNA